MPSPTSTADDGFLTRWAQFASRQQPLATAIIRIGVAIVFFWIGGLKRFKYEADGIIPFVANSPFFSWAFGDPDNYKAHMNPEGVLNPENRAWHDMNGTYPLSIAIGFIIIVIGALILLHYVHPAIGMLGAFLLIGFSLVTLSFLVTTPEVWVGAPAQGAADADLGFPFLSGRGRLVVKDCIQLGAGFMLMVDSAQAYLRHKQAHAR